MASKRLNIRYVPRADATPERERFALAEVYRLVLDSHAAREAKSREQGGTATEVQTEE